MSQTTKISRPRKSLHAAFKSPLQRNPGSRCIPKTETEDINNEIEMLKTKISNVDDEINQLQLQGYKADELQTHIGSLHRYNEIKDIGQMVIGRIAELQGVRTADLYNRYGLNIND